MDLLQEFLNKGGSGMEHKPDSRDRYIDESAFGATTELRKPTGLIEKIINSELEQSPIYQGSVPLCLSGTFTWLDNYDSIIKEDNHVILNPTDLYRNIKHYPGGTTKNDNGNSLKKRGVCLDDTKPHRGVVARGRKYAETYEVTKEMDDEAENFQIDGYYNCNAYSDMNTLKNIGPYAVGGYVGSSWNNNGVISIPRAGEKLFGHGFVSADWLGESNIGIVKKYTGLNLVVRDYGHRIIINWWNEDRLDIRVLHNGYNIIFATLLKNKLDTLIIKAKKSMIKFITRANNPDICLLNYDGKKCYIGPGISSLHTMFGKKAEQHLEVVSDDVWNSYLDGPNFDIRHSSLWNVAEFLVKNKQQNELGIALDILARAKNSEEDIQKLLEENKLI